MTKCKLMKGLMGATALTVLSTGTAFAQNDFTPAGELVSNTFTLNYEVNDTPQTEIENSASPTIFNVDRLVNVTVETLGDANVIENQTDVELPFVFVNNGNDTHAYFLTTEQEGSGPTEQFDTIAATPEDIIYYPDAADTNNDGNLSATERTAAITAGLEENYDDTNPPIVAPDDRVFVFVLQDIPAGQTTGDRAGVILVADTREDAAGFADVTADSDGNNDADATVVENVLADLAGDGAADAATDGSHSDTGYFIVQNPEVSATKEVFGVGATGAGTCVAIPGSAGTTGSPGTGYSKPAPTPANPTGNTAYFTPGSCVEYVIEVVNAGSTSATDIVLTDVLPDHLVFQEAAVRGALIPGSLAAPASPIECDGSAATCNVSLSNATIAAESGGVDTVGYLVIRALIE